MNETNKTLSETISEHLTESSEVYKQNELPPVELKATIPGLIDQKIELAHLYSEFRLSEQRVSNGIMNEMEPGARYIRDLNVRKIAIIREKFDRKFKDLLGVEDISELNDLDEAFAVLEEAGAANSENLTHWAVFLPKEGSEHRDHIALPVDGTKENKLHASKFKKVFGKNIADGYRLDRVELKETNEEVEQIDEMRVKVGPEQYHKGTVWHVVHHNGKEIGTVGTNAKEHHEKHGKWGFEDSRGSGRRNSQPKLNSKEQAVRALTDRHKEYVAKETNEEVEQIGKAFVIHKGKHAAGETSSLAGQTHYGVEIQDVYADEKEAQAHADTLNQGRGYKPEDQKNPAVASALYQVSPKNTKRVPGVPLNAVFKINEKAPPGMEDWVKGRKEDFKERYGDRWEEVLYRTAWKMYNKKEEAEQIDEIKGMRPNRKTAFEKSFVSPEAVKKHLKWGHTVRTKIDPDGKERKYIPRLWPHEGSPGGVFDINEIPDSHLDKYLPGRDKYGHPDIHKMYNDGIKNGINAWIKKQKTQINKMYPVKPWRVSEEVKQVDDAFAVLEGQTPAERLRWAGARRIARQLIPGAGKLQARIRAKDERDQAYYAGQEYAADGGKRGPTKPGDDYGDTNTMANRHRKRADRWTKIAQGQPPFKEEVEQIDEIKLKTAIRALHSMKDKGASPEDTKRVNRMSNAIARKWGEKGAAVADKAVSDIDAKQASSGSRDKYFAGDVLGRWRLRRHAADAEKAKLSDNRRIKTPNLPEEVEQIDEESAHLTVTKLKADGKHEEAGAAAFKHRLGRKYGPHFGLRSNKDKAEAAFHLGYDKAEMQSRKKVDKEVEQISGSVLSKLRAARAK